MFKPRPSAGSRAKCEKQRQSQASGVKRALGTWRVTQRKRILFIDNLFLFLLLKNPGPKYMTIEPDQSPLISIVFLALTLIGCESSPSPSRTYGSLAQLISIHTSLFFFFIYFIHYSQFVMAERQFISVTQRRQRKKYSICVVIIMKTKAYWAQCISFSLYYRILISIIDSEVTCP